MANFTNLEPQPIRQNRRLTKRDFVSKELRKWILGRGSVNFSADRLTGSPNAHFTSATYVNLAGPLTLTLQLNIRALVIFSVNGSSEQDVGGSDATGRTHYSINSSINGEISALFYDSFLTDATNVRENIISKPYAVTRSATLLKGTHNIYIQGKITINTNLESVLNSYSLDIVLLGN